MTENKRRKSAERKPGAVVIFGVI